MPHLTIIDVTGIQQYIFGSNRLKEIIGASEIVARATSTWVFEELLAEFRENTNLQGSKGNWFDLIDESTKVTDDGKLSAELVYAGGGNTLILFKTDVEAKSFAKRYSRRLLKDASGLEVVIAHSKAFNIDNGTVILEKIAETFDVLSQKKSNRPHSVPLRGLAVSSQCISTGGVATSFDKRDGNYIYLSTESRQKLDFASEAEIRLKNDICAEVTDWKGLEIPKDFDDLGRTRDQASYIAVVHTDGNGMGERIKQNSIGKTNRECINKMRTFSREIDEANKAALQKTISEILRCIDSESQTFNSPNGADFPLIQKDVKKNGIVTPETYFPFRPLIFGGDDLTFVCDGRVALALTAFYFKQLKAEELSDEKGPIYSRAGISIVKTHYPFRRAYELAEDLAASAKGRIKEIDEVEKKVFAMDWHIATSGLLGTLEEIREREYTPELDKSKDTRSERRKKMLEMRPVVLENQSDSGDWRTWKTFLDIINDFQGEKWNDKRNKVKRLREVLREGEAATKDFFILNKFIVEKSANNYESKMPKVPGSAIMIETTGWQGARCGYFDAIEMIDLFCPLEKIEEKVLEVTGA